MREVAATRMELLARKEQIALADQARDLLEKKREALMRELLREADSAMERSDALQQRAADARQALARAEAVAGPERVRSAALAARDHLPLRVETVNVMGVKVPHIEQKSIAHSVLDRGYAVTSTSIHIDEAATAFEAEVDAIIQLAGHELRLARLASEIQQTSRRLDALEHLLIPQLVAERSYIQLVLDERERAERFQLKLAKRLMERKRGMVP